VTDDAAGSSFPSQSVLEAYVAGEPQATEEIIRAVTPLIDGVLRRSSMDAFSKDDVFQTLVETLLFDRSWAVRADNPRAYVRAMAVNAVRTWYRRSRRMTLTPDAGDETEDPSMRADQALREQEVLKDLEQLRSELDDIERRLLDRMLEQGVEIMPAARELEQTQWRIRTLTAKLRKKLRRRL
jgi:RNA polymerase sigma factor (sigma-70 family)